VKSAWQLELPSEKTETQVRIWARQIAQGLTGGREWRELNPVSLFNCILEQLKRAKAPPLFRESVAKLFIAQLNERTIYANYNSHTGWLEPLQEFPSGHENEGFQPDV
jgi:hypothetical protein